jgi:fucose 4-O-acetylase-like acetyltransferase
MQNRYEWLDIARGISFLMIIYAHIDFKNKLLMAFFAPIFLTTFFFVSGYLFNTKRSFIETLEQRFRTLIIPWFIYGLINIFLSQIISFKQHVPLTAELIGMFKAVRAENDDFWFLPCLFVASVPFYIFIKYAPKKYLLPLSLIFLIINGVLVTDPIPWYIHLIAPAIFYMTLGYLFKQYETSFNFINSLNFLFILAPIYILQVSLYYYVNWNGLSLKEVSFTSTPYFVDGIVITITGLFVCISTSKQLNIFKSFLIFIGSNSLLYFCLHGKAFSLLQKIFSLAIPHFNDYAQSDFFRFAVGLIITIMTAIILIVPVMIINKFFPWSIGRGFSFFIKMPTKLS